MNVLFHPALYASSRPWAKRVAHLFAQGGATAAAEVDALVQRALQAAPGGVGQDAARQQVELLLARAYGRFVAHGRQLFAADAVLDVALAATRPPKCLPQWPQQAAAFFMVLPAGAGAFVWQEAGRLEVLLLACGFADGGGWWQRSDEVLALSLKPDSDLVLPDSAQLQPWRVALHDLFARLALLTQPQCVPEPPLPVAAEALRRGELPLHVLHWPQLPAAPFARDGYWRRQALAAGERLVWVLPR